MNDQHMPGSNAKAPYQPPKVVRVSLRPQEAVLGHCKVTGSTGAVSTGCINPLHVACRSMGS